MDAPEQPQRGVWRTSYPPGAKREPDWPVASEPELLIRVVPNESAFLKLDAAGLGAIVGRLVAAVPEERLEVNLDASDRTTQGEGRGGASPPDAIYFVLVWLGSRAVDRVTGGLADRIIDTALAWAKETMKPGPESYRHVTFYWPDGEPIRSQWLRYPPDAPEAQEIERP